jgi:hypothetical protein
MWSSLVCAAGEVGASDGWHASRRTEPYGGRVDYEQVGAIPARIQTKAADAAFRKALQARLAAGEICRIWWMPACSGTNLRR